MLFATFVTLLVIPSLYLVLDDVGNETAERLGDAVTFLHHDVTSEDEWKGVVGGIVGPTLSRFTVDLVGPKFAGAYLVLIVFALATMAILSRIRIPEPTAELLTSQLPQAHVTSTVVSSSV